MPTAGTPTPRGTRPPPHRRPAASGPPGVAPNRSPPSATARPPRHRAPKPPRTPHLRPLGTTARQTGPGRPGAAVAVNPTGFRPLGKAGLSTARRPEVAAVPTRRRRLVRAVWLTGPGRPGTAGEATEARRLRVPTGPTGFRRLVGAWVSVRIRCPGAAASPTDSRLLRGAAEPRRAGRPSVGRGPARAPRPDVVPIPTRTGPRPTRRTPRPPSRACARPPHGTPPR